MSRYLEAFFRHPFVLIAPIILAVAAAATYSLAQPRQYTASATVWVASSEPSDATGAVVPPDTSSAAKAVVVFQEFLKSRAFDIQVGRDGKLSAYYAANSPSRTGLSGLLLRAGTKLGLVSKDSGLSGGALDDQVAAAVTSDVVVAATGPQLVAITVTGPSAESVAGTATALYNAFSDQVIAARRATFQNDVHYYQGSAADAAQVVTAADTALSQYVASHPAPRNATDATETGLVDATTQAHQRYQAALDHLNQSQLTLAGVAANPGFHVVDPALVPGAPASITRHVLVSVLGGLFIGLLLMLCLLVLLTSVDRTLRSSADVERSLGLRVAASIPRLKKLAAQEN